MISRVTASCGKRHLVQKIATWGAWISRWSLSYSKTRTQNLLSNHSFPDILVWIFRTESRLDETNRTISLLKLFGGGCGCRQKGKFGMLMKQLTRTRVSSSDCLLLLFWLFWIHWFIIWINRMLFMWMLFMWMLIALLPMPCSLFSSNSTMGLASSLKQQCVLRVSTTPFKTRAIFRAWGWSPDILIMPSLTTFKLSGFSGRPYLTSEFSAEHKNATNAWN